MTSELEAYALVTFGVTAQTRNELRRTLTKWSQKTNLKRQSR